MKSARNKYDAVFYKSRKQYLVAGLIFSIIGLSSDTIDYFIHDETVLLFLNFTSLLLLLVAITGFLRGKINKTITAVMLVYAMVINILLTNLYFYLQNSPDWQFNILRDTIIIFVFISITVLLLNKIHIVILNLLYTALIGTISYLSPEPNYISSHLLFLSLILAGFSYALYMFDHILGLSIKEKKRLDDMVTKQEKAVLAHKNELEKVKAQHLEELVELKNKELLNKTLSITQNVEYKKKLTARIEKLLGHTTGVVEAGLINLLSDISASEKGMHWSEFDKRFKDVHQAFFEKIVSAAPNLTPSEIKLAALIKLGLTSKEISILNNNSVPSIEVARSRLRKKLQLKPSDNLFIYLSGI